MSGNWIAEAFCVPPGATPATAAATQNTQPDPFAAHLLNLMTSAIVN
ncbi:hypothetical protein H6F90_15435 [Trichocoleus sp. FACHB-591]|nr:hypothetical protein [Trichocoleus sp. FACHB-591]MBD2096531.1 hypothetical protein [Trichocoleus sp. FACHB-591]